MTHRRLNLTLTLAILCLATLPSALVWVFQPNRASFSSYNAQNSVFAADNVSIQNFSIIVLPDIQGYSRYYPWIVDNQTQWIVDNKEALNITFVSQLGDLVDRPDNLTEWENANSGLSKLDGNVPWATLPGNHDSFNHNLTTYNEFFGQDRFNGYSWYGGAYLAGDNSNSYQLFSGGGTNYLILHLEYNPSDDILYWASNIIDAYPDRKVIISTHDYMSGFVGIGKRSDAGEHIWHSLVKPHADQVFLVLCGHASSVDMITDEVNGHVVYQVLADYQNKTVDTQTNRALIEDGWLRIMQFCPSQDKVFVKTYSPVLNQYKNDAENEFTIDYKTAKASPARPEGTTNENNTIYIRQDGRVDPSTAPIQRNGDVYTFKGDISGSLIVERDNVVIDGDGFTLRGTGAEDYRPSVKPIDPSDPNYWDSWEAPPDSYVTPDSNNAGIYSYAKGLTIKNLKITDCWCAIELEYSADNTIIQNQITGNTQGIRISSASNNTIINNNIDSNSQGVTLKTAHDTMKGNSITNSKEYAIKLQWSFNKISENSISGKGYGVTLEGSSRNVFRANSFSEVKQVFSNAKWLYPENVQDVDNSNLVNGKPTYYWINKQDMTVPSDAGWVALVDCSRIKVENLNFAFGQEILLVQTTDSTVSKNTLSNDDLCIGLYQSEDNLIMENSLTKSYCGIQLHESNNNQIKQNMIANCTQGVYLDSSSGNQIQENNCTYNDQGIKLYVSDDNLLERNFMSKNEQGIHLTGLSVHDANITTLYCSTNNRIIDNDIANNEYGIYVSKGEKNKISLNHFTDNTNQAKIEPIDIEQSEDNITLSNFWDNGNMGNYWSDYTNKYPNAVETYPNTWNTPYVINEKNQDNYPLKIAGHGEQAGAPLMLILGALSAVIIVIIGITSFVYIKKKQKKM